jgi:hypothetical protein
VKATLPPKTLICCVIMPVSASNWQPFGAKLIASSRFGSFCMISCFHSCLNHTVSQNYRDCQQKSDQMSHDAKREILSLTEQMIALKATLVAATSASEQSEMKLHSSLQVWALVVHAVICGIGFSFGIVASTDIAWCRTRKANP